MGGEGCPLVFRSIDTIAYFSNKLLESRSSSPNYTSHKYWSEFGYFITFSSRSMPWQDKRRTIQTIFYAAKKCAPITKPASIHTTADIPLVGLRNIRPASLADA
jgi:hypothetical protein